MAIFSGRLCDRANCSQRPAREYSPRGGPVIGDGRSSKAVDTGLSTPSADPPPAHVSAALPEVFSLDLDAHSASAVEFEGQVPRTTLVEGDTVYGDPLERNQVVDAHVIVLPDSGDDSPPPTSLDPSGSQPSSSVALPVVGDLCAGVGAEVHGDLSADRSVSVSYSAAIAPDTRSVEVKKKTPKKHWFGDVFDLIHGQNVSDGKRGSFIAQSPRLRCPVLASCCRCAPAIPRFGLTFVKANVLVKLASKPRQHGRFVVWCA